MFAITQTEGSAPRLSALSLSPEKAFKVTSESRSEGKKAASVIALKHG